jgi:hypothetical protein
VDARPWSGRGRLRDAINIGFVWFLVAFLLLGAGSSLLDIGWPGDRLGVWPAVVVWSAAGTIGVAAGRRSWRASGRRRRHFRRMAGLCPDCAYDLTGNVSGVCPECGTGAPSARNTWGPLQRTGYSAPHTPWIHRAERARTSVRFATGTCAGSSNRSAKADPTS